MINNLKYCCSILFGKNFPLLLTYLLLFTFQSSFHKQILKSLNNKDRESLLEELAQLRTAVDELENQVNIH